MCENQGFLTNRLNTAILPPSIFQLATEFRLLTLTRQTLSLVAVYAAALNLRKIDCRQNDARHIDAKTGFVQLPPVFIQNRFMFSPPRLVCKPGFMCKTRNRPSFAPKVPFSTVFRSTLLDIYLKTVPKYCTTSVLYPTQVAATLPKSVCGNVGNVGNLEAVRTSSENRRVTACSPPAPARGGR